MQHFRDYLGQSVTPRPASPALPATPTRIPYGQMVALLAKLARGEAVDHPLQDDPRFAAGLAAARRMRGQ